MGYEVHFKFYEKKEQGGYDIENQKSFKKIVGKAIEDTPLEQLAKVVFGQFARRDIWVVDVEAYEFTKKKVSFKETKEGIVLKHKKFAYDLSCTDLTPVEEEEQEALPVVVQQQTQLRNVKPVVSAQNPLRWEIFEPHPDIASIAKKMNLPFTIGKKYPIFEEKPDPRNVLFGMTYLTEDDNGNRRTMNDKYFVPDIKTLENGFTPDDRPLSERSHSDTYVVDGKQMVLPQIYTHRR